MVVSPRRRSLLASVSLHLAAALVAMVASRAAPPPTALPATSAPAPVEVDFLPPSAAPAPATGSAPPAAPPTALAPGAARPSVLPPLEALFA